MSSEINSMANRKLIGILGVLFGLLGIVVISLIDKGKLTLSDSDLFIVKYFVLIGLINCSLYFVIYGLLQFYGFIVPYYSENKTEFDKAKNIVCGIILLSPVWISGTATVFLRSETIIWKILWVCFLLYLALFFWGGIKKLIRPRGAPSRE